MDEAVFRRCSQAVSSESHFCTYFTLTVKTVCSQTEGLIIKQEDRQTKLTDNENNINPSAPDDA